MPRNTTGGTGHKAQCNREGAKARHNRCFIDDLLDDIRTGEAIEDIQIGRVTKRMGNGRMEVFYLEEVVDETKQDGWMLQEGKGKKEHRVVERIIPLRGGLTGKAKKTVWVEVDSLVMIVETGLAVTTHEITAVFSPEQVARLRKLRPDMDKRYFLKGPAETSVHNDAGFEFEEEKQGEVDIDAI